jgi:hypothetical protein
MAAAFGLAVGSPDPDEDAGVKPRLPQAAVLHHKQCDAAAADAHIAVYDGRLSAYNGRYGRSGAWANRVLARLAGPQSMADRHTLRAALARRGPPSVLSPRGRRRGRTSREIGRRVASPQACGLILG